MRKKDFSGLMIEPAAVPVHIRAESLKKKFFFSLNIRMKIRLSKIFENQRGINCKCLVKSFYDLKVLNFLQISK